MAQGKQPKKQKPLVVLDDLAGMRIGNLVVDKRANGKARGGVVRARWWCRCDCGNYVPIFHDDLITKKATNCGKCVYAGKLCRYDLDGEYGKGWTINHGIEFIFDLEDYDRIKKYGWRDTPYGYIEAADPSGSRPIKIHNLIMKNRNMRYMYDHINRDKTDNRKCNLRKATTAQNTKNASISKRNKSGVSGVRFNTRANKWVAYITCDYKRYNLGTFEDFDSAVRARLLAEKEYFGDFAPQKNLYQKYGIEG